MTEEKKAAAPNKKKKKKFKIDINKMGVNIDKNEYYEIVLSNAGRPEMHH